MSIYDNPMFSYAKVGEGDYFETLRNRLEEEYKTNIGDVGQDYGLQQEMRRDEYSRGISSLTEGRKRLREDYTTSKENLNLELSNIAQRTFQRYVAKGAHTPSQFNLQNLATRSARLEKERQDYIAGRSYDRGVFDISSKQQEIDWRYTFDKKLQEIEKTRKIRDYKSKTNQALTGLNRTVTEWADVNTQSSLASGVFSQKVLSDYEDTQLLPDEYKFNPNISYGY